MIFNFTSIGVTLTRNNTPRNPLFYPFASSLIAFLTTLIIKAESLRDLTISIISFISSSKTINFAHFAKSGRSPDPKVFLK